MSFPMGTAHTRSCNT